MNIEPAGRNNGGEIYFEYFLKFLAATPPPAFTLKKWFMGTPGELIKIKLRERSGEKRGKEKVSRGGEEESWSKDGKLSLRIAG